MAKIASLKKIVDKPTRTKRVKLTRSEQYLINIKYMGDEPVLSRDVYVSESEYGRALNWYNYMCSRNQAREYLETYLHDTNRHEDLRAVKNVSDSMLPETLCWVARMLTRRAKLASTSIEWMENQLAGIRSGVICKTTKLAGQDTQRSVDATAVPDTSTSPASDFIGRLEEEIDRVGWSISVYDRLVAEEASSSIAGAVADHFREVASEAAQLIGKNPHRDLLEGYSHYTKSQLKERAKFYASIISDCDRYELKKRATRKPRVAKPISNEKKLQRVKLQAESKEYRAVSLPADRIIGSLEVWTFNTRYKIFTRLVASKGSSLDVSGTSITGYDETQSGTYRSGRKSLQAVETILTGHTKGIKQLLASSKKLDNIQYRLNENILLLRAAKSG